MSTATLPTTADITRAVADSDYYAEQLAALKGAEQRILAFEGRHFANPGRKEQAIRDEFGYSAIRYYQKLSRLIDNPAALAADPILVGRLRRVRDTRRAQRSSKAAVR